MTDYDQLVESWINGNRSFVAAEVVRMKPHEILAFADEFKRDVPDPADFGLLERLVMAAESKRH